jgi:hypothetical protein
VKKVVNDLIARVFCGGQGASGVPIPLAGLASRATPNTAKKVATPVGEQGTPNPAGARAGWAVWRRWPLGYTTLAAGRRASQPTEGIRPRGRLAIPPILLSRTH